MSDYNGFWGGPGKTAEHTEKRRMFRILRKVPSDKLRTGKWKPLSLSKREPPGTGR
ncbi:Uncharacterized protein dnm_079470 [Desulfonema magnum]|uniref:Uncharacterized protein n=1 Tax=Desulfonema magnum TaxID=45655 RepID=A0A975GT87_9BACT|nr:Uncharacterized protein dnm_079470 [Desulfonema magnum]